MLLCSFQFFFGDDNYMKSFEIEIQRASSAPPPLLTAGSKRVTFFRTFLSTNHVAATRIESTGLSLSTNHVAATRVETSLS